LSRKPARRLEVLSRDQIDTIHSVTITLMEQVGVRIHHTEALETLNRMGIDVDFKNRIAKIREEFVKEAIRETPSHFDYYGRKGHISIGGDDVSFADGGNPIKLLDFEGIYRRALLNDLSEFIRAYDYLDYVDFIMGPFTPVGDVRDDLHHLYDFRVKIANTTKPFTHAHYTLGSAEAIDLIEMASKVAGGEDELRKKPMIMGWENPLSPLGHINEQVDAMLAFAKRGLPVLIAAAPQSGSTAPATLAGLLVQQNAENLSAIVMLQSVTEPGRRAPAIYGTAPATFDQRYGTMVYGCPESAMINIASSQIAKYYGLPCRGTAGTTESKLPDMQAGYEAMMTLLLTAMSGCNIIVNATGGALGPGIDAMSLEKAVIDNEVAAHVSRILDGITVNDETLAVDVMREVGPEGHYLSHKHTLKHFTAEHPMPKISDRMPIDQWLKEQGKDVRYRAREKAQEIVRTYRPEPLDRNLGRQLDEFIEAAAKRGRGSDS
jgi:trimethylamine--corrinoid protein Co-methyltransferase